MSVSAMSLKFDSYKHFIGFVSLSRIYRNSYVKELHRRIIKKVRGERYEVNCEGYSSVAYRTLTFLYCELPGWGLDTTHVCLIQNDDYWLV